MRLDRAAQGVRLDSALGLLEARIEGDRLHVDALTPEALRAHVGAIERFFSRAGKAYPFSARFESALPARAGLASSAASSAALAGALARLCGLSPSSSVMVQWVYEGELDIQKRGSITGSACAVGGGVQVVRAGVPEPLGVAPAVPLVVVDTQEPCPTSVTTGIVRERLARDRAGTEAIFDAIEACARSGLDALRHADAGRLGGLFAENQGHLARLGVSTRKIDAVLGAIAPHVHGAKITGAGGGGCVVAIPRAGHEEARERVAVGLHCVSFPIRITPVGLRVEGGE
ncbi:MAG: hypothetical protein HY608_06655 [Planctomycetes bacterium]|nr:hypothetical protein [Planctomycetota bacterium]